MAGPDPYAGIADSAEPGTDPYAGIAIVAAPQRQIQMDFNKPRDAIIQDINRAPPELREQIRKAYGDFVGKQNQPGGVTQDVLNFGRAAIGSGTFGFSDEIAAGLKTGFGYAGDYDTELAAQRGYNRQAEAASPWASTAGSVVGAVAPAFIPGVGLASTIARGGASAAGTATSLGRAALVGAGQGALTGVGEGETAGERLTGGAIGGVVGGVGGAALQRASNVFLAPRGASAVDPVMDANLQRIGVNPDTISHFVRSEDPGVRTFGTRFAQRGIDAATPVREAFARDIQSVGLAGAQHVGGDLQAAIQRGGQAIRSAADTASDQMTAQMLANRGAVTQTIGAATPTAMTNTANTVNAILVDNAQLGGAALGPRVQQVINAIQDGDLTFDTAARLRTEIGRLHKLSNRSTVAEDLAQAPYLERIYGALSDDLAATARGTGQGNAWNQYNTANRALGDERRALRKAFGPGAGDDEALVNKLRSWTSTSGARSGNANAFTQAFDRANNPQGARDVAQALYASMLNKTANNYPGGSPQKAFTQLSGQTRQGQDLMRRLSPDTADVVEAHRMVAQRLSEMITARNHSNTAAALEMAGMATTGGALPAIGAWATGQHDPVTMGLLTSGGAAAGALFSRGRQGQVAQHLLRGGAYRPPLLPATIGRSLQGLGSGSGRIAAQLYGAQ